MEEATRAAWEQHLQNSHSPTWLQKQHPNPHLLLLGKLSQTDWAGGVGRCCPKLPPLRRRDLTDMKSGRCQKNGKTWMASAGMGSSVTSWAKALSRSFNMAVTGCHRLPQAAIDCHRMSQTDTDQNRL